MGKLFFLGIILIILTGCSTTKSFEPYDICVREKAELSIIVKNKLTHIADTTLAFISGEIIDKKTKEPAEYSYIVCRNINTGFIYGGITDDTGKFSISVPAGNYEFKIDNIGYTPLEQNLKFGQGEMRKLIIELGSAERIVHYEIISNKKLVSNKYKKGKKK